ncbi:MAG: hypothetical protein K5829_07915 [Treponema sp.]|nr:hypothetical protein [Treponema sp.]
MHTALINFKSKLFLSVSIFTIAFSLHAETFRISELKIANITQNPECEEIIKVGLSDAAAIFLPEDKTFLQGIEIKLDIPENAAVWRNLLACSIYDKITPFPSTEQIDYSGTCFYHAIVPSKLSWILQIPFQADANFKTNQYITKVDTPPDCTKNFLYFRLYPAMKGISDDILDSIITVTVKPILSDKGKFNYSLTTEDEELQPCSIFIDDTSYDFSDKNSILLDTGIHNISVISEFYRTEVRTVRIEQAKTTELQIEMKSIEPTMLITAPSGTSVLLDEEEFTTFGKEFIISEGDHKLQFSIGDYEIIRTISAIKGKTYKINFLMDLQISEE